MIINLKIENFRSYKNETNVSFVSNSKIRKNKDHETNVGGLSVIKNCAILGSNASGKSNLIRAISFLKNIVLGLPNIDNFSFKGQENKPTSIDIVFSKKDKIYNYGFKIIKSKKLISYYEIVSEYLYEIKKTSSYLVFNIEKDKVTISGKYLNDKNLKLYIDGYFRGINQLFLSYINMPDKIIENEDLRKILLDSYLFIKNDLVVITSKDDKNFSLIDSSNVKNISIYLKKFDTGIEEIKFSKCSREEVIKSIPETMFQQFIYDANRLGKSDFTIFNNKDLLQINLTKNGIDIQKLVSKHNNIDGFFNFESESEGTIRMMFLISVLFTPGNEEKVFFIDELERSMHPLMSKKLIEEFQKLNFLFRNQLIFTTHYEKIIDECVRRDEIYFCDKNNQGESYVVSLLEYESRSDSSVSKNYLEGRYGGVPKLEVDL